MLHTTFRLLKDAGACRGPYLMLARHLGGIKKYGRDMPIPLVVGLNEKFDWDDLLWVIHPGFMPENQKTECDRIARLFGADCIIHVLPKFENCYPTIHETRNAIKTVRAFACGKASSQDLFTARAAIERVDCCHHIIRACSELLQSDSFWKWLGEACDYAERTSYDEDAELQWQRARLRQYLEDPDTKPLPLPRKSRRKAA